MFFPDRFLVRHISKRAAKALFGVASIAFFVVGFASDSSIDPSRWSAGEWIAWRDKQIESILRPSPRFGPGPVIAREEVLSKCAEAFRVMERALRSDPAFWSTDPLRQKELFTFYKFVRAQQWMSVRGTNGEPSHGLGLEVSDVEHADLAGNAIEFPDLLKSQEFLEKMADPKGYREAVAMIENHNEGLPAAQKWFVLPYAAQFIKSVDRTTYGRLLVLVPGDLVEKWFLFAIATPDLDPVPSVVSVSVVSIVKSPSGGPAKAFLADFVRWKDPLSGYRLVATTRLSKNPSKNCYDCHKSAVIPIRPELEYEFDRAGMLVPKVRDIGVIPALVNARIRAYGKVDFGPQDTAAYGPSIGPPERERSDAFIRESSEIVLSDESVRRISSAMKCGGCHDSFAPINYPEAVRTDRDVKSVKSQLGIAQTFVEKGWMPPGNDLTTEERKALWRCLSREYFDQESGKGIFVDWLKGSYFSVK